MYVKVKYYKGQMGGYHGAEYTYFTNLALTDGDKVIAPTKNEARQRGIVTAVNVPAPSFPCREIAEYDPEAEITEVQA